MVKKDTITKIKPIIKPVSFTENNEVDVKILEYIKKNNLAFSSYVKDLIVCDMRKLEQKNEIAEAINNLASVISNSNFNVVNNKNNNDELIYEKTGDEEKKNIIGNLLNMSK